MIIFDTRMVQGYPLQYYSPSFPVQYHQYDYYSMSEISEEVMMPSSPHSLQSDSENSMSSIDVSSTTIQQKPRGLSGVTKSPLKTTLTSTTEVSDVKCGWHQCGLWFESLDMLANHVSKAHAASGPNGLFYCGWEGCSRNNKGFNARYKMLVHVRTHTNQKPHQCCECEKSFSRAENLKIHSRSHSGEKPYVCPVPGCNKAYSNSSDRFKHTRTHQVEKPYMCKVVGCNKRYTDPSSLRKHVKTYKHFVNDASKTSPPVIPNAVTVQPAPTPQPDAPRLENNNSNVLSRHDCSIPAHSCCLQTCLSKAAELLKLGAFINFRENRIEDVTWNKLMEQQTNKLYSDYSERIQMDMDVPLDLTVHRK